MKRLLGLIVLIVLLSGCKTRYIPMNTVKHDSIYINKVKYDSIYHKDSIYMLIKGDTVYKYQFKYRYRDKLLRDTVSVTRVDSVKVSYPVEKPLTKWQKVKIELGSWAFGGVIALILVISGRFVYKRIV